MGCSGGGSIRALKRQMDRRDSETVGRAVYDPFTFDEGDDDAKVFDLGDKRAEKTGKSEPISDAKVKRYKDYLASHPDKQAHILERGLTLATIDQFDIGYDEQRDRWTLPVRDRSNMLVNIRRYYPDGNPKMRNAPGHGSPPRLYPYENLDNDTVWVVEGEFDALLTTQNGFPAVTGTHGASTWEASWSKLFVGKQVVICYDNDKEGRTGAKKAARSIAPHAVSVKILPALGEDEGYDLSDWWLHGGTAERLQELVDATKEAKPKDREQEEEVEATVVPVQVIGSMDSTTNGKPLSMAVTITGKRNPTYSVPHRTLMTCTLDAGPKCKTCPMNVEWEGEHEVVLDKRDVTTIIKFIDATDNQILEHLRKHIGAAKCNRLEREEIENQTIEEVFVTSAIDRRNDSEEADYTQRRIYNIGSHDTKTNTQASVIGTTIPNPKDRRNEFMSWELKEAVTSLDKFEMTTAMHKRLKVFQPTKGQDPLSKCREIAADFSANVTHITGRERMHMAMDFVWHSLLHFPFDGKIISRGWLEFLLVGDTRTGKSEAAIHLTDHYGLGHVIGCEGATFAGLVGAVKQVSDAWTIQWGEITINDRRLVVLDEASGLSQDIISQLSDIRSRGMAQLTKAETAQTRARCRMIWISNPRKGKFVDEKKYEGIDIIEDLIGNPEDIARFDFAMSVSASDVPNEKINTWRKAKVPHRYTSELCRDLVLWAWSRRPEHVEWDNDAYKLVYRGAEWLGKTYVDHPPLIQRTNVREKIARLAVAIAARTFSTDASGESLCVKVDHVKAAGNFLHELYKYDNFGYLRLSERVHRNRKIAHRNRTQIKKWLRENPRLLDFLLDRRGSFRSQDLEEMAHMDRSDVNFCLGKLTEAKMITKSKSQIMLEPELHSLLKEIERDR